MAHTGYYSDLSSFDNVDQALAQAELYRDQAGASATAAADSAAAALASQEVVENAVDTTDANATAAAASAADALASSNTAAASATMAAGSATAASGSATIASAGATTATTQAGIATTQATTATTQAGLASTSATNAAASATTASTAATNAGNSATAAAGSATTAGTAATNAGNSATAASGSASTASTAATNAGNSATAAAASAAAALVSENNAATSASVASGGFKNRVINGDCRVYQRGASIVLSSNVSGYGGPDRYFGANIGTGGSATQSYTTLTDGVYTKPFVNLAITSVPATVAGGSYLSGISTLIEGANCFDMKNRAVTASFVFSATVAGTYSFALRDSVGTRSYVTTFTVANSTPVRITIPIPAIPSAASLDNNANVGLQINIGGVNTGTFQTATLNAWQSANVFTASTATAWHTTTTNRISVTDLQLELGTIATPFERRPMGLETSLCQRYYNKDTTYGNGYNTAGQGITSNVSFPAMMRAAPTVVVARGSSSNMSTGFTNTIVTVGGFVGFGTALITGAALATWNWTADAEL